MKKILKHLGVALCWSFIVLGVVSKATTSNSGEDGSIGTSSIWNWKYRNPYPGTIWCTKEDNETLHIYILLERQTIFSDVVHYFDDDGIMREYTKLERLKSGWSTTHLIQIGDKLYLDGKVFLEGYLIPDMHYSQRLPFLKAYPLEKKKK